MFLYVIFCNRNKIWYLQEKLYESGKNIYVSNDEKNNPNTQTYNKIIWKKVKRTRVNTINTNAQEENETVYFFIGTCQNNIEQPQNEIKQIHYKRINIPSNIKIFP